jgi:hypothetical protein
MSGDKPVAIPTFDCAQSGFAKQFAKANVCAGGRDMRKQDIWFDYDRYRQLLADAVDERKRLALIQVLIEERAMDRLAAQRASDRAAMTATTVSKVLGASRR